MEPLPKETHPELAETFATFEQILGFVPNSLLTMQRKPQIVEGFEALTRAVMDPDGEVDAGFSASSPTSPAVVRDASTARPTRWWRQALRGVPENKLADLWDYPTSPLFSDAERAALGFALAAGSVPNAVTTGHFARLRRHWTENQIVEILAAVCLYGFLNRWNDSMATELEETPRRIGERYLAGTGWDGGKHPRREQGTEP
jgi:alkylhydroperoxidase family enzyme